MVDLPGNQILVACGSVRDPSKDDRGAIVGSFVSAALAVLVVPLGLIVLGLKTRPSFAAVIISVILAFVSAVIVVVLPGFRLLM
jgi:hypothetical protein